MKRKILYIGNYLQSNKTNRSYMQTLGVLLEGESFYMTYASNKHNKILRLLDMIFAFLKQRNRIDAVLIDTYSTHNFYFAFILSQLCRLFKKPYMPILHGGNLPARLIKDPKKSKWLFANAFINISPSLYLKETFEEFGYHNSIHIPNTLEIKDYNFKKRNFETIKLLWVRSFSKIYNPKMAVTVLKKLTDSGYKASLCMVGPDSDGSLNDVKSYANELGVQVEFTGKLSKKEWVKKSDAFNIFINTTNFDNMPVSVIEAMALGLPVVSTNVGGMPYLIKNEQEGLLVDKNNSEQMADALLKIINDPTVANTLSRNARSKVELYDWSIVKEKWLGLFEEI